MLAGNDGDSSESCHVEEVYTFFPSVFSIPGILNYLSRKLHFVPLSLQNRNLKFPFTFVSIFESWNLKTIFPFLKSFSWQVSPRLKLCKISKLTSCQSSQVTVFRVWVHLYQPFRVDKTWRPCGSKATFIKTAIETKSCKQVWIKRGLTETFL